MVDVMDWLTMNRIPMHGDYLIVLNGIPDDKFRSLIEVVRETFRNDNDYLPYYENQKYENYLVGVKNLLKDINERTGGPARSSPGEAPGKHGIEHIDLSAANPDPERGEEEEDVDDIFYYYIWSKLFDSTDDITPGGDLSDAIILECLSSAFSVYKHVPGKVSTDHNCTGLSSAFKARLNSITSLGGGSIKRKYKRSNSKRAKSKRGKSKRGKSKRGKSKRGKSKRGKSKRGKSKRGKSKRGKSKRDKSKRGKTKSRR
jgi:hypothetical protein